MANGKGLVEDILVFKVMRDPEIMENIDLIKLASATQQALAETQDFPTHHRLPKVAVVVKAPVIAIRYPLDDGQVRRFQIRFENEEHYYEAMKWLSRARVVTSEAGMFPTRRPQTSHSTSSVPPLTGQTSSYPIMHNTALHSGLECSSNDMGGVPTAIPVFQQTVQPREPPHSLTPHHPSLSRFDRLMGQSEIPTGKERSLEQQGSIMSHIQHRGSGVLTCIDESWASGVSPIKNFPSGTAEALNASFLQGEVDIVASQKIPAQPIHLYEPRPSTAPTFQSQHLSQILPPKRDLPFSTSASYQPTQSTFEQVKSDLTTARGEDCKSKANDPTKIQSWNDSKGGAKNSALPENSVQPIPSDSTPEIGSKRKRGIVKKQSGAPVPKRARATASRKKAPIKHDTEKSAVPSVEELLKEAQKVSLPDGDNFSNIDTQKLVAQVELRENSGPKKAPLHDAKSKGKCAAEKEQALETDIAHSRLLESAEKKRPTTADELTNKANNPTETHDEHSGDMQPSKSNGSSAIIGASHSLESSQRSLTSHAELKTTELRETGPATKHDTVQPPASPEDLPKQPLLARVPINDPLFTEPTIMHLPSRLPISSHSESLMPAQPTTPPPPPQQQQQQQPPESEPVRWTTLPEREQHSFLNTFFAEQILDPAFTKLCIMLESLPTVRQLIQN